MESYDQQLHTRVREEQKTVEDLRMLAKLDRMPLNKTIKDLIQYCEANLPSDPLVHPVKDNPFKEKRGCQLL